MCGDCRVIDIHTNPNEVEDHGPMNQPLSFATADDSEELARAELYGLLARLWIAPPDAPLLAQFGVAVTEAPQPGGFLEAPWQSLVAAMRAATPASAAAEYDALFGGVGKPEVFLYGSYYLAGFLNERPLAVLRADLAELGLTREESRGETEDHIACVFEVMRYLIAGDDVAVAQPGAAAALLPRPCADLGRQARRRRRRASRRRAVARRRRVHARLRAGRDAGFRYAGIAR